MSSLFNKLKQGVEHAVTVSQDKIQETQLRAQHRTIEREKEEQFKTLGATLYSMHHAGEIQLESLHPQFQVLEEIDARLEAKQKEIDEYAAHAAATGAPSPSGVMTDRHCECGAILSPSAKFCPECGRPAPVEPV